MSALVIAEHDHNTLNPSTLNSITAAGQMASTVEVIVIGYQCQAVANQVAQVPNVTKVILVDHLVYQHQLVENLSPVIIKLADQYTHVVTPATTTGKNLLPQVAALLNTDQISDVISVIDANTFVKPIYAGNAIATMQSSAKIKVATIRTTGFDASPSTGGKAELIDYSCVIEQTVSSFVNQEKSKSKRPDLTTASTVISGGRGFGSAENFSKIYQLADKLNAAVGASRAAVDAGYVSNDLQVGQTGKIVAPDLYIALGISGAIQHLAGMKDSKIIVAINTDEDAPIFEIASYSLVADLFDVLLELEKKL